MTTSIKVIMAGHNVAITTVDLEPDDPRLISAEKPD